MGCTLSHSEAAADRKDQKNDRKGATLPPKSLKKESNNKEPNIAVMNFDEDALKDFNENYSKHCESQRREDSERQRSEQEAATRQEESRKKREEQQEREYREFERERQMEQEQLCDDLESGKIRQDHLQLIDV